MKFYMFCILFLAVLSLSCGNNKGLETQIQQLKAESSRKDQKIKELELVIESMKEKLDYAVSNYRIVFPDDQKIEGEFMKEVFSDKPVLEPSARCIETSPISSSKGSGHERN